MDTTFTDAIDRFSSVRALVVGDVMVDRYFYGAVDRISPEAPIPILALKKEDYTLGGAGNVVANLVALGVSVNLVGVCGNDATADTLRRILSDMGVKADGLVVDDQRPTTQKTRLIAGHQHLLRADQEMTTFVPDSLTDEMLKRVEALLPETDLLICSDYGKGVLTDAFLQQVIAAAGKAGKPVIVDPKGRNYARYRGATLITPNRKELSDATHGKAIVSDSEVVAAASQIVTACDIDAVLVTRSQDGMSLIERENGEIKAKHLPTHARDVYDVSGAGDTVVATLAAGMAAGLDMTSSARLANFAGGIVVGKIGTATVSPAELVQALKTEHDGDRDDDLQFADGRHYATLTEAKDIVARWQRKGLKVGLTNGCFDILHAGHVTYLGQAKSRCDKLVLALNHDESIRILKGPTRPVNDHNSRAQVMMALKSIDLVVLFGAHKAGEDNTASPVIAVVKPDIYFKGGDYTIATLPEAKVVHSYGGQVEILGLVDGHSTTAIIQRSQLAS
jgi:D-beta-D-heptose 7-phosphate kinase/D-beta-D-heptose 1-phosphate adenosyltransferase